MSTDGWLPDGVGYHDLPGCSRADEARQDAIDKLDERYARGEFRAEEAQARADACEEDREFDRDAWAEQFLAEQLEERERWGRDW
jgi:hypothetical protein